MLEIWIDTFLDNLHSTRSRTQFHLTCYTFFFVAAVLSEFTCFATPRQRVHTSLLTENSTATATPLTCPLTLDFLYLHRPHDRDRGEKGQ